jgi:Ca2+-binding RTX toxin-like protein
MFIDPLEPRRLLTITSATFDPATGTLALVGNDKRDIVEMTSLPGGGVEADYDGNTVDYTGNIKLISVKTNGGGDIVNLAGVVGIPCFVDGGAGGDYITGGTGNDTLKGGGGLDAVIGGLGNDVLDGGLQGDLIVGGQGNDTIVAGSGTDNFDTITGGKGNDTIDYSKSTVGVIAHPGALDDTTVSDLIYGDVETMIGSAFGDVLWNGTKRGMLINGGAGNDSIQGGSGRDTIIGGAGDNTIAGHGGNDSIDISAGGKDSVDGCSGVDTVIGAGPEDKLLNVP